MDKIKFRLEEGNSEFDGDKVSELQNLQRDIETVLDYSLGNSHDPADYVDALYNYFKARPKVVDGLIKSMLEDGSVRPSLEAFTNKIALMHLHARQAMQKINEENSIEIDKTVKITAPKRTGYIVYNSVEKQKQALEKIRNSEDVNDIFPDIARA